MQNRQNPDKWNPKMNSSKRIRILLRSIIALLLIFVSICLNRQSEAQTPDTSNTYPRSRIYLAYPSSYSVPYSLRGYYPDFTERFLIGDNDAYFPPPKIRLSPEGDWFI
ncbi:MAG: hypothetical protein LBB88_07565, partial [Planctomycetaceae bacterium]|nr:hypothetical protein [Planctomycetaceae bacterium]